MRDCQVTTFEALCTALQHPAVTADPKTVCCLLQTCRSWRHAVQHAAAGTTVINCSSLHSIAKMSQFAAWIPKHAGMLAEIHLTTPETGRDGLSAEDYATAAEQIIILALQNANATAAAAAMGRVGKLAAAAAVRQPLRLQQFSTDFLSGPGLLAAMPTATLTVLTVEHVKGYPSANSPAIAQALAGLTGLRDLALDRYTEAPARLADCCLHAIAQPSLLTRLGIRWTAEDVQLSLLPQQLQRLELSASCGKQPLQLQHLTGLDSLKLHLNGAPAAKSMLPQQLTRLKISTRGYGADPGLQHLGIDSLQQLVTLEVSNGMLELQLMHRVACLPKLQHVLLRYTYGSVALRAAPGWQHLPQLRDLCIEDWTMQALDLEATEDLMQHIGAATSLTSLLFKSLLYRPGMLCSHAQICRHLTGLQQLRELQLSYDGGRGCSRDALHLTALTGLTRLALFGATDMDDVCVVGSPVGCGSCATCSWCPVACTAQQSRLLAP